MQLVHCSLEDDDFILAAPIPVPEKYCNIGSGAKKYCFFTGTLGKQNIQ